MSWTLQLSHASNGCPSVRGAHHKDHIEHAILGTKDQTNNGRIASMVPIKPSHVMLFGHQQGSWIPGWTNISSNQTRDFLHFTKGGVECQVMSEDTRPRLWGPGEVLAWSRVWNGFEFTSPWPHLLHINNIPTYAHKYCIYRDHK